MEDHLSRVIGWWVQRVVRVRWWVVILTFLLSAGSLQYTVNNLNIDTDLADMLSAELPFRQNYDRYKDAFPQYIDTLVIVVEANTPELTHQVTGELSSRLKQIDTQIKGIYVPGEGDFFKRQALMYMGLEKLEEQTDTLAAMQPFLGRLMYDQSLRGLFNMLGNALEAVEDGESLDLAPLLGRLNKAVVANLKGEDYRVSWQELMLGDASDMDLRRQFIVVQPHMDFSALLAAEQAMHDIRQLLRSVEMAYGHGVRLRVTGTVALEYEELESVSRGAGIAASLALVMVLVILTAGLRSAGLILATLISLLVGLLLTAGFATLAVGELNLISVAFAVLYIGLGVDFAIHLCLHYRESVRAGETGQAALNSAVRGVGPSLVLCAITTAVGFFAFIPTTYSGVSELGLISGTGMFISLAVSLTLLPALLSAWPMRDAHRQADLKWGGWKTSLTKWPYRHAHTVRWAVVLIGLSALLTLPNVQFDNNPINLRNPETESVATFRDLVENSSTSPWSATILASDAAQADAYQVQLNQLASVDKAVAIGYFVPSDQKDKLVIIEDIALLLGPELGSGPRGALPSIDEQLKAYASFEDVLDAFIASPKDLPWRKTIAELRQNLKLFANQLTGAGIEQVSNRFSELQQSLLHYLPNSLHLLETSLGATEFSLKELPTDLVDRWISKQGIYRIEVFPKKDISDNDALREFVADIRTVAPEATGDPVVSLEAAAVVVTAFQQAFAGALIVITLILILIMGGLIEALFVLVPLLLAGLLTVALFVLSGAAFNFANIIALPLLLGMGVDNGIHMVNRIRNTASVHSINLLKTSTARAVLFSALTTMVSFGNLSFSSHPGTASMGKILTLGVLMTLLSTLIILPALLPQSRSILRHSDRG